MAPTTIGQLQALKRPELQKLAKEHDLKANLSNKALIDLLADKLGLNGSTESATEEEEEVAAQLIPEVASEPTAVNADIDSILQAHKEEIYSQVDTMLAPIRTQLETIQATLNTLTERVEPANSESDLTAQFNAIQQTLDSHVDQALDDLGRSLEETPALRRKEARSPLKNSILAAEIEMEEGTPAEHEADSTMSSVGAVINTQPEPSVHSPSFFGKVSRKTGPKSPSPKGDQTPSTAKKSMPIATLPFPLFGFGRTPATTVLTPAEPASAPAPAKPVIEAPTPVTTSTRKAKTAPRASMVDISNTQKVPSSLKRRSTTSFPSGASTPLTKKTMFAIDNEKDDFEDIAGDPLASAAKIAVDKEAVISPRSSWWFKA